MGFMPIGFCCSHCVLYDEEHTCLKMKSKPGETLSEEFKRSRIVPIRTSIEEGILKVVVEQEGEEIPIFIDLQNHLNSR